MPRRGQLTGKVGREKCTPEQEEFADALRGIYDTRLAHATLAANAKRLYCSPGALSQALGAHRVPAEDFVTSMYRVAEESPGEPLGVSLEALLELRRSAAAAGLLARKGLAPAVGVAPVRHRHNADSGINESGDEPAPCWDGTAAAAELESAGRFSELSALMAHAAAALPPGEIALASAALTAAGLDHATDALLRGAGRRGPAFALSVVSSLTHVGLHAHVPAVLAGSDSMEGR
ncbi:hypothetical protein KDL01_11130 [Actinospica durhamensis]|uniref:Uncharacterized protein n=1 Tax=Actinospica durhamensis TaxID=1508375 RepID=A0A941ELG1_9ACTN|nr:hypothetical protein [Actinospica durhamensis]MBR7833822.1 hypothetical protein [Actinospica durhamensis]